MESDKFKDTLKIICLKGEEKLELALKDGKKSKSILKLASQCSPRATFNKKIVYGCNIDGLGTSRLVSNKTSK